VVDKSRYEEPARWPPRRLTIILRKVAQATAVVVKYLFVGAIVAVAVLWCSQEMEHSTELRHGLAHDRDR
jgi:hypothetical protein